jgi:hypothetical protein
VPGENRPNNRPPRRRHLRLLGFDYSGEGAYFVTICTRERECLFGPVVDWKMRLNDVGRVLCDKQRLKFQKRLACAKELAEPEMNMFSAFGSDGLSAP